jgi:hypothetical protein
MCTKRIYREDRGLVDKWTGREEETNLKSESRTEERR